MKEWRRSLDLEQAVQPEYPRRMITTLEGPSSDEPEFNESEQDPTSTVVLFRAVSHAEFADVIAHGMFRPGPNSYASGKFFGEAGGDALKWGNALEGPGNFRVLEAEFPKAVADRFMRFPGLDGIGPARFGTFGELNGPTIRLWNGSP